MSRVLPRTRAINRSHARLTEGLQADAMQANRPASLTITSDLIESFLKNLKETGRTDETIYTYRGHLDRLCGHLGEGGTIYPGTLDRLGQQMLEEGYSPNTVNVCFAAINSFLEYCGRRDLQVAKMEKVYEVQPEITRNEYLRLLSAAKQMGKEREYLLIKVFATTGISVTDLSKVTVEAVKEGTVVVNGRAGKKTRLLIAAGLQKELLDYIDRKGILTGPVFLSRNGKPMERSNVNARISALARDARVDELKCNPRCLQRLYKTTMDGITESLEALMQQMYMQILDKEQLETGWEAE